MMPMAVIKTNLLRVVQGHRWKGGLLGRCIQKCAQAGAPGIMRRSSRAEVWAPGNVGGTQMKGMKR